MSLLFRVLYAAHANGTHHKLALDALALLEGPDGEAWRRLFLKHAEAYLAGAKAPDREFKDFKNHVLHVSDDWWGGAIQETWTWYNRLVQNLASERWADAVHAAGVMSHYLVDPIHPFHTGQSEAEAIVHRAVEWSIAQSYEKLRAHPFDEALATAPQPGAGPDWIAELLRECALRAHAHYETLLLDYDYDKGVADPATGLGPQAQGAIAGLVALAVRTLALVLERAFYDSGARAPEVSLSVETVLAGLAVPQKWILNRIADHGERQAVAAIYAELKATGTVVATLPEEIRSVRETRAEEASAAARRRSVSLRLQQAGAEEPRVTVAPSLAAAPRPAASGISRPPPAAPAPAHRAPVASEPAALGAPRGPRLAASDTVEAAPSIGPRTAERLAGIGIRTVQALVSEDAGEIARRLAVGHIDARLVRDWQDQAQLAMSLPGVSGTSAQVLVGAGYRCVADLREMDAKVLHAALSRYARTPAGERIVRGSREPTINEAALWIEAARRMAEAA